MKQPRYLAGLALAAGMGVQQAHACSVCMGGADDTMTRGMQVGILVLLGVIGSVLLSLGGFMGYLAHRRHMVQSGRIES